MPRATSTAPPGGIVTAPPSVRASTIGAARSISGVAAGKGKRIAAALPGRAGVLGPYASVKSATPLGAGVALSAPSGCGVTEARQVPAKATRRTSSAPALEIPALARPAFGGASSCASRIRTPEGFPVANAK